MTTGPQEQATAREHLLSLRAQGYSLAEIGRQVGRSPRALRFVLNGERDGQALVDALAELDFDGQVTHQAPRAVDREGHFVKVRAAGGRMVEPAAPKGAGVKRRRARSAQTAPQDVQQLISAARADGLSYRQIGDLVGRSADTIRKAHHGRTGLAATDPLRRPLLELYTTGTVAHQAGRATKNDGTFRKVKGPDGQYVVPPTPKGSHPPQPREQRPTRDKIAPRPGGVASRSTEQPAVTVLPPAAPSTLRGRAKPKGPALHRQEFGGGQVQYRGTVSKYGRQDRARMNPEIVDAVNAASNARRRVEFSLFVAETDQAIPFGNHGGWDAATLAAALERSNGDAWGCFQGLIEERYPKKTYGERTPVSIQLTVW